jgi:hypothetical protein
VIGNEVRRHYEELWGESSREARFRVMGREIEVSKWDAARNPEQVNIYATVGASAHESPGRDAKHRLEFFVGLKPAKDAIAKPLAMVALDPVLHGTELDHGHSVTYPDPLWPGTEMHSLLVVRPLVEIVPMLMTLEGFHVEFLQAIPVFASEVAFKSKHRAEGLLERWQTAKVRFWNPDRGPEPRFEDEH